jgi:hypothetical protein
MVRKQCLACNNFRTSLFMSPILRICPRLCMNVQRL